MDPPSQHVESKTSEKEDQGPRPAVERLRRCNENMCLIKKTNIVENTSGYDFHWESVSDLERAKQDQNEYDQKMKQREHAEQWQVVRKTKLTKRERQARATENSGMKLTASCSCCPGSASRPTLPENQNSQPTASLTDARAFKNLPAEVGVNALTREELPEVLHAVIPWKGHEDGWTCVRTVMDFGAVDSVAPTIMAPIGKYCCVPRELAGA